MQHFLWMLSLGGRNKVRDIVFVEESVSIPANAFNSIYASIYVIIQGADMESRQDNIEQLPTQAEVIVPEEQTQQPQEQMPLRRSTRERRNVIPGDYIVFLQEHENTDGLVEGDPIYFHQVM